MEQTVEGVQMRFASDVGSVGASAGLTMLRRFDSPSEIIALADEDMYARKLEIKEQHLPAALVVDPQQVVRLFEQLRSRPAQLAAAAP